MDNLVFSESYIDSLVKNYCNSERTYKLIKDLVKVNYQSLVNFIYTIILYYSNIYHATDNEIEDRYKIKKLYKYRKDITVNDIIECDISSLTTSFMSETLDFNDFFYDTIKDNLFNTLNEENVDELLEVIISVVANVINDINFTLYTYVINRYKDNDSKIIMLPQVYGNYLFLSFVV